MSSDRDALMGAIVADPDDDTVRLVFADWCEENDHSAWARLIREMVAQPTLRFSVYGGSRRWTYPDRWAAVGLLEPGWEECRVARGFVSEIICSEMWWADHEETVRRLYPARRINRNVAMVI